MVKHAGGVDVPRAGEINGIGETDMLPDVAGTVEVVAAERVLDPSRGAQERGVVDVIAERRV